MHIAATSDLDQISDIEIFYEALKRIKKPDLLLLAGDMYEFRNPHQYGEILDYLKLIKWNCPIIACFGNREFDEDENDIKKICGKRITFLENEQIILKIKRKTIGIVGSRGALDIPTWWQFTNIKGIKDIYAERIGKIKELLNDLRCDIKILLTHYSPTFKTLKGENPEIYGGLGTEKLEKVLIATKTTFAVHGHAHYGLPLAFVEQIPIFNVGFHANKHKIIEIYPDKLPKTGLKKYVG